MHEGRHAVSVGLDVGEGTPRVRVDIQGRWLRQTLAQDEARNRRLSEWTTPGTSALHMSQSPRPALIFRRGRHEISRGGCAGSGRSGGP